MSPRLTALASLIGILLAGLPLLHLSLPQPSTASQPAPDKESQPKQRIFAELYYTGKPSSITIRQQGKIIAQRRNPEPHLWELELELAASKSIELELEIHWKESKSMDTQAAKLQLSPRGEESRSASSWSLGNGAPLHDILNFTWS